MIDADDRAYLARCVDLAEQTLARGNEPFGSILVEGGRIVAEAVNKVGNGDHTQHPEFELARWAATNLPAERRPRATVYTSGEHCPMCSAAHAWAGLGRIVYASSTAQLTGWRADLGLPPGPVRPLPITDIAPDVPVDGPDEELADRVHELHRRHARSHR
ncbi:nucleoside deaminase [Nocardia wallacei]|uniref:nucleoside deaminase n=1 Tax=Nocardia wallacei TaxID=480035 RepID=UPI002457A7B8|nr:nucleoside deaminase [Nocardia wallacei]